METSWISRKGGILEKGGYDPLTNYVHSPPPNLIFCSGPPNYFSLKFLGPPLKLGGAATMILFWYCKMKVLAISGPWQGWFRYSKIVMDMYKAWSWGSETHEILMKVIEFWKDLCQKLCCLLNRSVFDSLTRKHRKSELVQDNLVILGEPCVHASWWNAPNID